MAYGFPTEEGDDDSLRRDQEEESQREDEQRALALQQTQGDANAAALEPPSGSRGGQGGIVDESGLPPGYLPLRQQSRDPNQNLPEGLSPVAPVAGQEPSQQQQGGGLNSAIEEARQSGLVVTSGYRSPDDPLSRANPKSAHTQGLAWDLRAHTGEDADAVMAKQRELFDKRGMQEGRDYKFIDEVRNPSGHATGPHVHVQLTDSGIGNYQGQAAPSGTQELPEGLSPIPGHELPKQQGLPQEGQKVPFYGDALYPDIAKQRAHLVAELQNNPRLLEYAAAAVSQEGHGGDTIQAITEALFNRTNQRNTTIADQLFNGFYGPIIGETLIGL
jgi:hypothetical protein